MSFCLLSSAVYIFCLHNVSTLIVKPCRLHLLSFVIISYFLLLFLSRSSHFFVLHFCASFILSPDTFFVPVIYYLFRLYVYISLIKYYLSPKVSINLCSSISLNVLVTLYLLLSSSFSRFTSFFLSFSLSHSLPLSLIFNLILSPHISTLLDT